MSVGICSIDDCDDPSHKNISSLCHKHYKIQDASRKRDKRIQSPPTMFHSVESMFTMAKERATWKVTEAAAAQLEIEHAASLCGFTRPQQEQSLWQLLNPVNLLKRWLVGNKAIAAPPAPPSQFVTPTRLHGLPPSQSETPTLLFGQPPSVVSVESTPASPGTKRDPSTIPVSSVEDLYSDESGIMSLLILGQPRDGKSYSARFLVEQLHQRNEYKHLILITKKGSYLNSENVISGIARINQVIWWDCLEKTKDKKEIVTNLCRKCSDWAKGRTTQQTLVIVDDMTDAIRDGELSLQRLLTEGSHLRTDLVVIYHGFPPAIKQLRSLRDNVKNILLTRTDFVRDITDKTTWLSPADTGKPAMVKEHAQCFISTSNRIQGLIKRSWAEEGRPIGEYFVPFKGNLINPQNDLLRGLVGTEADTFSIMNRKTELWKQIKEEAMELHRHQVLIRQRQEDFENEMMIGFNTLSIEEADDIEEEDIEEEDIEEED